MQRDDELAYLLRSDNRSSLLVTLAADQPLDKTALERRLSASRRTVSRVLNDLTDRGYIQEETDGFRLTSFGDVIAEAYRECRERTSIATQYRPILANIDATAVDLDPLLLQDADLTVSTEISPYAPITRALEVRQGGSRIRVASPFVEKCSVEQLANRLERGEDFEFEVILPADRYEVAQSQIGAGDAFRREMRADAVDMFVHPGSIPLLFTVVDDTALLGVNVDDEPHALVESTDRATREWVERRIDEYRAEAIPVEKYRQ